MIGVHFQRPEIAGIMPHLPVSQVTLDSSVTEQVSTTLEFPTTAVDEGIAEWRRANGGVFTISIAEILNATDATLATPPRQDASPPAQAS